MKPFLVRYYHTALKLTIDTVLSRRCFIAGTIKIVPIEAAPAEAVMLPEESAGESMQKKGYQEYAIQQAAYEVPLKANRYTFSSKRGCSVILGSTTGTCSHCQKKFES